MILTFKFRVKDRTSRKRLNRLAVAANQVWNFCVATQREAERRRKGGRNVRWPTAFDLVKLCTGVAADLGLHSDTVNAICRQFVASRDTHRRCPRFRSSFGSKRSLGWVPYIPRAVKIGEHDVTYLKCRYRLWMHRALDGAFKAGAFIQDARGRWYATFACEVANNLPAGAGEIGIDLGLKTLAACSDGRKIPALRHYRRYEAALARAQRAGRKKRVRAIHAKIANARRHQLHVESARLTRENKLIAVGDVNAAQLARTRMAKSVLDAGWSAFRHMLRYKAARRQAVCVEIDERWTSQACSECGALGGPKGIAGLGVRSWDCPECNASHDRDVNSARLILASGRNAALRLTESPALKGGEGVTTARPRC